MESWVLHVERHLRCVSLSVCCHFQDEENMNKTVFATEVKHSLFGKQAVTGRQSSSLCCAVISKPEECCSHLEKLIICIITAFQFKPECRASYVELSYRNCSAFRHTKSSNNTDSFYMKVQAWIKMNPLHYDLKYSITVWKWLLHSNVSIELVSLKMMSHCFDYNLFNYSEKSNIFS